MKKLVLIAFILFVSSCASKILVKNCVTTGDATYYVCEPLSLSGQ